MANTIFSSEGALLFIMVATVALGFWLQRFKVFKTLGPALTVIVMGIVMSNLRIVPTSSPTYDAISGYCVPLSVSICLLSLDLKQMRKLSKEPIIALASAIFSVCVAALVFGILFANKIDEGWKVAGMFVGTYTGGSSNLTAIAVGRQQEHHRLGQCRRLCGGHPHADPDVCYPRPVQEFQMAEKAVAL